MLVLGLDTTGLHCSAAILRGQSCLSYISERIGRGHAERLGPMVLDAFADAGVTPGDIGRVAVCTGPGSFTGLRVALSFAKGFVLPRGLPLIGIDRLALAQCSDPNALVVSDIKRGEAVIKRPNQALSIMSHADAEAQAEQFDGPVIRGPDVDVRILAQMAQRVTAKDYPAAAFYGRKPDAKLPGGVDPS